MTQLLLGDILTEIEVAWFSSVILETNFSHHHVEELSDIIRAVFLVSSQGLLPFHAKKEVDPVKVFPEEAVLFTTDRGNGLKYSTQEIRVFA